MIRFEVTEEPGPGVDGERFMHVPGHGLFHGVMGASGDIQIGEDRLRSIMASAHAPEALSHALEKALGTAWDAELEPYRYAGDGAPVTLLTRVGDCSSRSKRICAVRRPRWRSGSRTQTASRVSCGSPARYAT